MVNQTITLCATGPRGLPKELFYEGHRVLNWIGMHGAFQEFFVSPARFGTIHFGNWLLILLSLQRECMDGSLRVVARLTRFWLPAYRRIS